MAGFEWPETPPYVPTVPGENGWCVRDALCQLFGWEDGSEEWRRFIEAPEGPDTPRLAEHLGLTVLLVPPDWTELDRRAAHPGVALFDFPNYKMSHVVYVPDVQWLLRYWPTPDGLPNGTPPRNTGWPLGPEHMARRPVLRAVLIDEEQPPREP
jgi:hypothetical protein